MVTARQKDQVRRYFARVSNQDKRTKALKAALEVLDERAQNAPRQGLIDEDDLVAALADFIPPLDNAGQQPPIDATVRSFFDSSILWYQPDAAAVPAAAGPAGALPLGPLVVETAEDVKTRRTKIEVGAPISQAIIFPRNPTGFWKALYPHPWLADYTAELVGYTTCADPVAQKAIQARAARTIHQLWFTAWSEVLPPATVRDMFRPRHKRLLVLMEGWFHGIPPSTCTSDTIPVEHIRQWQALIEQLLELVVLCNLRGFNITRSCSDTTATTAFWLALEKAAHGTEGCNYFTALSFAGAAKDSSAPPNFRPAGTAR
jgi:hypothetical protein